MSPFLGTRGAGSNRAFGYAGAAAPAQVTGLTATDFGTSRAYNDGRIDLSWNAPANNGATISGYLIERSTDGSTYSTLVANTGSSATTYSNTGLSSNQIYYYKVSAINAAGTGLASAAANATSTTVPQAPTVSVVDVGTGRAYNNGAATVTISGGATGGKTISNYTATSSPGSFTATSGSPLTVTGLQSATAYTFSVVATNANGNSTATISNSITATTVPQAPTIGTATATGASSASVTFTPGANGGSAITSYQAVPSSGPTATGSASPITLTGLTTGLAITIAVRAQNANGFSAYSANSNSVTPAITVGTFSLSTAFPVGKTSPNGFSTNDRGVVVGGRTSTSGSSGNLEGWYWNGSTWTTANSTYPSLYRSVTSTSATEGQSLGGEDGGAAQATTNYFNGSSWSSATALPAPRREVYGGGSFGNNSAVLVAGNDVNNSNIHYYRTGTGAWSTGTAYPFTTPVSMTHINFNKVFASYNNQPQRTVYETTSLGGSWTSTGVGWPITFFEIAIINGIPFGVSNVNTQGIYSIASNGTATYQKENPVAATWNNFALTGRTNQIQLVSGISSNVNQTWNYLATLTA